MPLIEIRARDIAQCLCEALVDACLGEPLAIVGGQHPPGPWTVELIPTDEQISIKAYGAGDSWPELLGVFSVQYPTGPRILMLDEPYCESVAQAAQRALEALAAAKAALAR